MNTGEHQDIYELYAEALLRIGAKHNYDYEYLSKLITNNISARHTRNRHKKRIANVHSKLNSEPSYKEDTEFIEILKELTFI